MWNMVTSKPGECSFAIMASLMAYMQHTAEQYPMPRFLSLEPTHWMKAILFGSTSSDSLLMWPLNGPEADRMRSNSRAEMTLSWVL